MRHELKKYKKAIRRGVSQLTATCKVQTQNHTTRVVEFSSHSSDFRPPTHLRSRQEPAPAAGRGPRRPASGSAPAPGTSAASARTAAATQGGHRSILLCANSSNTKHCNYWGGTSRGKTERITKVGIMVLFLRSIQMEDNGLRRSRITQQQTDALTELLAFRAAAPSYSSTFLHAANTACLGAHWYCTVPSSSILRYQTELTTQDASMVRYI